MCVSNWTVSLSVNQSVSLVNFSVCLSVCSSFCLCVCLFLCVCILCAIVFVCSRESRQAQHIAESAAHLCYAASLGISLVLLVVAISGAWRHMSACAIGWQPISACAIGGISPHVPWLLTRLSQQAFTGEAFTRFGH